MSIFIIRIRPTIILSIFKKNNIKIPTISISFENFEFEKNISDESKIIKKICKEQKIKNHTAVISKNLLNEYDDIFCKEIDQPTTDGLNTFIISRIAKEMNHKVAYSGLGGDELFCDYGTLNKIKLIFINKFVKSLGIKEFLKIFFKKINFRILNLKIYLIMMRYLKFIALYDLYLLKVKN